MKSIRDFFKEFVMYLRRHWRFVFYVVLIAFIFFVNTLHESYPDEFDNISGGKFILEGKFPSSGFFTHHGPVAYWIAAVVQIFSGTSFVRFRIVYAAFLFLFSLFSYRLIIKRFGSRVAFYPMFLFMLAVGATYFWAHMLLADALAGFMLLPVYLILFLSMIYGRKLTIPDIVVISVLSFLTLFSSLTYLYLVIIIYLTTLSLIVRGLSVRELVPTLRKPLLILVLPFAFFGTYLFLTNGINDYVQQNIVFNSKYYIYNYPRPEGSVNINPIRFAIMIAHDFYFNMYGLLANAKDFNFTFPFNGALAVADVSLIVILLLNRQYSILIFVLLMLIYANARSNPLNSRDTDYQSSVYIILSMANTAFLLPYLYNLLSKPVEMGKKVISGFLLILVMIYAFFGSVFLFARFSNKVFEKYMGKTPLIYDRPQLSPILNQLIIDDDYMWIGPFEFEELYYAKGKLPSKFHILIPGMGKATYLQDQMVADFTKNKPKIMMFDQRFFILGSSPEMFANIFMKFVHENYITLYDYRDSQGKQYLSVKPVNERVDLETKLYIDKNRVEEVVDRMMKEGLIRIKEKNNPTVQ